MGRPDERGLRIFLTISGSAVEADVPFGGGIAPGAGVDQLQGLEQRGIRWRKVGVTRKNRQDASVWNGFFGVTFCDY